ncbi:ATP-binding protein [Deinococcus planocerae]|uniref:ATP-binding protein n=1 Tax=Deinococcus planocerae TaxID=1737569 RepID=UPI000C7F6790|nr:tetratricopeptide repeat protein [Deinococcus planocerae]
MHDTTAAFVQVLGRPRVTLGGVVHPFVPDKRHQLLAYLACQGSWVERERLAGLFWPDHSPGSARANLRQLLTLVRGLAWVPGLEVDGPRLRWALGTDLGAFQRAVAEQDWAAALACYGGSLLDGLDGDGTGEFAAWLELTRRRVHDAWRAARLRQAEALSRQGAHLEAAELLSPLLEGDELDEEALHARVGALWRAGGHGQARQTHAAFVTRLREELGLGPTAELDALGEALRSGRGPEATPPAPAPAPAGPVLPAATTSFVGRDLELAEITRRLADPASRLLTLVGPGGVGKTRLALEAARGLAGGFPGGVFFVPLEALGEGALLAQSVAAALGLALQGHADPLAQVARFIGDRRLLLVLDNFEHLLDGAPLVPELLRRCPGLRLLVTSRERLGVEGEWLLPLEGLDYPRDGKPGPVEGAAFDAVALFLERARRVKPDFHLTAENFPHLLRVCRLVEGSPLGLELAAVWVRLLPIAEIAHELGENLDFLSGERNRSKRHQNLRAAFEHSWRLLTPGEQEVLRRLAVFQGGFRLEAARQVAGASLAVLAALTDKSLLRRTPDGRYDRHALISQYTRERLAEHPGEEAGVLALHGRYSLAFLVEQGGLVRGPRGEAALAALDEELENIRLAWTWAAGGEGLAELRRAAGPIALYFDSHERYREALALYAQAAAAFEGRPEDQLARGEMLGRQGWFAMRLGRHEEARRLGERGLALMPPGSRSAMPVTRTLGAVAFLTGDYPEAARRYRETLALAERHGDPDIRARVLNNLASLETSLGHLNEAEEAVGALLALGQPYYTVLGLGSRGYLALTAGRLAEARAALERSLTLAGKHDWQDHIPDLTRILATVAHEQGAHEEARERGEGLLALTRANDDPLMLISALHIVGRASAALGDHRAAFRHLGEGLRVALSVGETPQLLEGLMYLAEARVGQGQNREAAPLLLLVLCHPSAYHRLKVLAARLLETLRPQLTPGELERAETQGDPARLGALAWEALAGLDLAGHRPP